MRPALERRIREQRARVLTRSYDYRQRHHARGVWFRLRGVLADASAAYVVTEDEAQRLVAEGWRVEPVGRELEPPRVIIRAEASRAAQIASAQQVPVRLGGDVLAARWLVIVPFETTDPARPPSS